LSIFIKKDGKNVLPISFYIKILVFFGFIGLSAIAMQPLQAALNDAMTDIRMEFFKTLESYSGLEIQYSSLRPAFFGSVNVRDLNFTNGSTPLFTVSRIRIDFSVWELLFNKNILINTVLVDKLVINIDTQRDKETIDFLEMLINSESSILINFFPENTSYQIRRASINFIHENISAQTQDVNLNIKKSADEFLLNGSFFVQFKYSHFFNTVVILESEIAFTGIGSGDVDEGNANVSISYIKCSLQDEAAREATFFNSPLNAGMPREMFTVIPFDIGLIFKNNTFNVSNLAGNFSIEYEVNYDLDSGSFFANAFFDNFIMTEKIKFSEQWNDSDYFLDMKMNGLASISYMAQKDTLDYIIDLNGLNMRESMTGGSPLVDAFTVNASGDKNNIVFNRLNFSSSNTKGLDDTWRSGGIFPSGGFFHGQIGFQGSINFEPLLPRGTLYFNDFSLTGRDSLTSVLNVSTKGNEIHLNSAYSSVAGTVLNDLSVLIIPENNDIELSVTCYINDGEGAGIFVDAFVNGNQNQGEVSVLLNSLPVYDLLELLKPFTDIISVPAFYNSYLQDFIIDADLFISTDFNNIVFNVPNLNFSFGDFQGIIAVSGTNRQFTVSESVIDIYNNEFTLSAGMDFANPMDLSFTVNAGYLDYSWNIEGQIIDRTTLIVYDPNGLNIYGNLTGTGAVSGYMEASNYPVPAGDQTLYFNFYSAMRYDSFDFWNVDIDHFTAYYSTDEYLSFTGIADQDGADIRNIVYVDSIGRLAGNVNLSWDMDFSHFGLTLNISDGLQAGEHYYLEGTLIEEKINVSAYVSQMHVNRFLKSEQTMLVSADINAAWDSINLFNAQIDVSSFSANFANTPLNASAGITMTNDELLLRNLRVDYGKIRAVMPQLLIDRSKGVVSAAAGVETYTFGRKLDGNIEISANFNTIDSWLDINKAIDIFDGSILFNDVVYGNTVYEEFAFNFMRDEKIILFSGGLKNMIRLEMDSDGYFFLGLTSPFPVQGTVTGIYDKGIIDAYTQNFYLDLQQLYSFFGVPNDFNIAGGYITGMMEFRGPFWNPGLYGTGFASSLRIQVPGYINEDIKPVPFVVHAEGNDMTFGPVVSAVGSGSGIINGFMHFENWVPIDIRLDINIPQDTPVPYDLEISGFLANGYASGNMNINFLMDELLEISGNLYTNNAELSLIMENLQAQPDFSRFYQNIALHSIVDFKITTGPVIEFTWPSSNPIIRANPEMGTVIDVYSDTRAAQFWLGADVNIRSGEIYYFDRSFYIREGKIIFNESEAGFNPLITARAEIRDRSETGSVTISMIVENQPLLRFEPRFESYPNLTQLEIYSILGQNLNSYQGDNNTEMAQRFLLTSGTDLLTQIITSSEALSQFAFFRQFEKQIRDIFRLDMFSIRTRILQNAVVYGVSTFGNSVFDMGNIVGNYFDNTTVFIGKYIGRDMFFQAMLRMRYDPKSSSFGGLVFEPDIGIELQSPILNIRWDFFPYHPENWWVSDNSITLTWSMSY